MALSDEQNISHAKLKMYSASHKLVGSVRQASAILSLCSETETQLGDPIHEVGSCVLQIPK